MVQVFAKLAIPKLQEPIQAYATKFAKDWGKFAKAVIKVGDDHMDQEIEKFEQEKIKCEKNVFGDKGA